MIMMSCKRESNLRWQILLLLFILQIPSWVSAAKSPPSNAQGQNTQNFISTNQVDSTQRSVDEGDEHMLNAVGSRPPSCDHKCGRCMPCAAIQGPATADHLDVQYANYEPEGWKCKCGSSFYNP